MKIVILLLLSCTSIIGSSPVIKSIDGQQIPFSSTLAAESPVIQSLLQAAITPTKNPEFRLNFTKETINLTIILVEQPTLFNNLRKFASYEQLIDIANCLDFLDIQPRRFRDLIFNVMQAQEHYLQRDPDAPKLTDELEQLYLNFSREKVVKQRTNIVRNIKHDIWIIKRLQKDKKISTGDTLALLDQLKHLQYKMGLITQKYLRLRLTNSEALTLLLK